MRLWSLHPGYLDSKGLVALWREGLLAKAVLEGRTRGYRHHPQLERFKSHLDPKAAINVYLWAVVEEAEIRGYNFNRAKLDPKHTCEKISVSDGQLAYEFDHLQAKLRIRDLDQFMRNQKVGSKVRSHPLVEVNRGDIADWERVDG